MKFFGKSERRVVASDGLLILMALLMGSCASVGGLSPASNGGDRDYPIYSVMAERAPFYLKTSPLARGGKGAHPYLYLSKGMTVTMLESSTPYSNVSLINGMVGWMPITVLAPQMSAGETEGSSGVSPAPGSPKPPLSQDLPAPGGSPVRPRVNR